MNRRPRGRSFPACFALLVGLLAAAGCREAQPDNEYIAEVAAHRAERERRLQAEDGWLSLIGLFWLEEGENPLGSDPAGAIVLPEGTAPPRAGVLVHEGGAVRLIAAPGAGFTLGGEPVSERLLTDDRDGKPDLLELGRLRMYAIRRGDRFALRVKDPESPARREFRGLDYYPIDPSFRVEARLERHAAPRPVEVPTVVGTVSQMFSPGVLEFSLRGERFELEPLVDEPEQTRLFIIFRDETTGHETYGAGRYLYADLEGNRAVLDFNKAYNPPCAFTPFATCPLPPPANRLQVAIAAGERTYSEH